MAMGRNWPTHSLFGHYLENEMNRYYPATSSNQEKQIWDRLNYLLESLEQIRSESSTKVREIEEQVRGLRVVIDAVQDPLTQGDAFVGFGSTSAIPSTGGNAAPVDAQYIVAASDPTLTNERVATDTNTLDWDFGTAGQAKADVVVDSPITSGASGVGFDQTVDLDNNARVAVSKNSGAVVGTRRELNFIEGSNITLTINDDAGNEEVDITIAATGGGGGPYPTLTPPVVADFTWVNQGTSTTVESATVTALYPQIPGGSNVRLLVKSLPAPPYIVTGGIALVANRDNFAEAGILLREAATQELVTCQLASFSSDMSYNNNRWNSPTSYNSTPFNFEGPYPQGIVFLQIEDDGTNRYFRIGFDGVNFLTFGTESNTAFCTPDQAGFFVNASSAVSTAMGSFFHFDIS